jgi:hypothetical protein
LDKTCLQSPQLFAYIKQNQLKATYNARINNLSKIYCIIL